MASAHWHSSVPHEIRELCEAACSHSPRQLDALKLKSHDYGARKIAQIFGITEKSARDLLDRARLNVKREQAARQGYQH